MEAEIQMVDSYVTKYNFIVSKKVLGNTDVSIDGKLGYTQLNEEQIDNKVLVGIEMQNDISIKDSENGEDIGNINLTMIGVFEFNKDVDKEKIKRYLEINGAAVLYQQMRAYISANTALTNSVPNIILPLLNFVNNNENNNNNI